MLRKIFKHIKKTIAEEYKFIIFLFLLYIILLFPVDYYITIGGGIDDVSSRISVASKNKSKGSFNISYVTQLDGTILTYGLSYLIPNWERENANDYKYDESESLEDIQFRNDLDLITANGTATYWAYNLANKSIKEKKSKLYVITISPEYETNLKVQDEIISIDNHTYNSVAEYKEYLQTKEAGSEVIIKIVRDKKEQLIKTTLHQNNKQVVLGVVLQYAREYETSPKVDISFKNSESGPSGGLITTLEIYNQLTKRDLTKGLKIAGTGTIEEDGTIGQIGGVEHKLLGAESDKADIFLVPSGKNYQAAKKYKQIKKLKVKLVEVKTIQDAINKLEGLN